ncbi:MAG: hypothetical protein ACI4SH_05595 [Candidatus Scatosoma sp.]
MKLEKAKRGEWKVSINYVCGSRFYQVYRNLRDSEPDHSGNREYYENKIYDTKEQAQSVAKVLNDI